MGTTHRVGAVALGILALFASAPPANAQDGARRPAAPAKNSLAQAAKAAFEAELIKLEQGMGRVESVLRWSVRLLEAEAEGHAKNVINATVQAARSRHLTRVKRFEADTQLRVKHGGANKLDLAALVYFRTQALRWVEQAGGIPESKQGPDLSHVRVGQKYHYRLNTGGMDLDQIWEVTAIDGNGIKYDLTTIMNGRALGEPTALLWVQPKALPNAPAVPKRKALRTEAITVAGKEWDCWVVESAGTKSWCPKLGDLGTFPPVVKSLRGDQVTMELVKIEQ
jgi:hypothetical protein